MEGSQGCLPGILLEQMIGNGCPFLAREDKERNKFRSFWGESSEIEIQDGASRAQHTDHRVMGLDGISSVRLDKK